MSRHVRHEQDLGDPWYGWCLICILFLHHVLTNCVISVRIESDGDVICQTGARWEDINDALKERGIPLFFPVGIHLRDHTVIKFGW